MNEYVESFAQLDDQLNAYQAMYNPLYYTMQFIDGLRDDVKSVVLVHRPKDLDTAFILAQLQEEFGDSIKKTDHKKAESGFHSRPYSKGPLQFACPTQGEQVV